MVIEIRFNFQIFVQFAEKAISKLTLNIRWNFKQLCRTKQDFGVRGTLKPDKRGKTGFSSVARGEGIFFARSSSPA